ncbi:NAD-dependent protein deacetylase [Aeromicrobium sp. CTD01-1L150]|uniref:NAD-dependent protein deacetylase n=1 Tax=Aeromicrobium sp. CTD01-1L150 TaxID=3341830 RepID=UPI0035BFA28D
MADLRRLTELIGRGDVLVLTGAGVSTDSGIPDYRGPGSPPRTPMTFQEFIASRDNRRRYWARSHVGWARMGGAQPNPGHHAVASLQAAGLLSGLITQNVDGLHTRAGHPGVIDLHGRIDRVVCLDCRDVTARTRLQRRLDALNPGWSDQEVALAPDGDVVIERTETFVVADCERCGGRLKPDVVFFGENVAKDLVQRCYALTDDAAAVLVVGSSLHVMSGLRFVRRARSAGTPVAIVNRGPTRGDDLATLRVDAGCSETLMALRAGLLSSADAGAPSPAGSPARP